MACARVVAVVLGILLAFMLTEALGSQDQVQSSSTGHTDPHQYQRPQYPTEDSRRQPERLQSQTVDQRQPQRLQSQTVDQRQPQRLQSQTVDQRQPQRQQPQIVDQRQPQRLQSQTVDQRQPQRLQSQTGDSRQYQRQQPQIVDQRQPQRWQPATATTTTADPSSASSHSSSFNSTISFRGEVPTVESSSSVTYSTEVIGSDGRMRGSCAYTDPHQNYMKIDYVEYINGTIDILSTKPRNLEGAIGHLRACKQRAQAVGPTTRGEIQETLGSTQGQGNVNVQTNWLEGPSIISSNSVTYRTEIIGPDGRMKGRCSYTDSDGDIIKVNYIQQVSGTINILSTKPRNLEDAIGHLRTCKQRAQAVAKATRERVQETMRRTKERIDEQQRALRERLEQQSIALRNMFRTPRPNYPSYNTYPRYRRYPSYFPFNYWY